MLAEMRLMVVGLKFEVQIPEVPSFACFTIFSSLLFNHSFTYIILLRQRAKHRKELGERCQK